MYTQFFGNYLYSKGYVTKEQLISAMQCQPKDKALVAALSLFNGFMSAGEIEYVKQLQAESTKNFGELAIENGYLTQQQVLDIFNSPKPNFLILGELFVEEGVFSYEKFEYILADYRSQHEFLDMELNQENKEDIQRLLNNFALLSETSIPEFGQSYFELLFNNLVRYIGEDFITLPPEVCKEFATDHCVSQTINGINVIKIYLNMDSSTAINFAERYTNEAFPLFNEYVEASIEDFINLHNGLFIVNASNSNSNELSLGIIEHNDHDLLSFDTVTYSFPIYYSFGIVHILMEIKSYV